MRKLGVRVCELRKVLIRTFKQVLLVMLLNTIDLKSDENQELANSSIT